MLDVPWLEAHREVPFFVFLHVFDPHGPYKPRPPYDTLWGDPARRKEQEMQIGKVKGLRPAGGKRGHRPHPRELEKAGIDPDYFVAQERSRQKDWYGG